MSIGSVTPGDNFPCVRRISYSNIDFQYPFKSLYVKTNPGEGYGLISDILYEDINIYYPVWYNIYIGPQQMKQPSGEGPGCMTYPFGGACPTNPNVDVKNITIRNLNSTGGFLPPGVIRCNESNPCTGINFENVNIEGWWSELGLGFVTEYAYGNSTSAVPDPGFGKASEHVFEFFSLDSALALVQDLARLKQKESEDFHDWEVLLGIVVWALSEAIHLI